MRLLALVAAVSVSGCNYMRHPSEATTWGQPTGTMVLGLEARGAVINAFLQNRGRQPQRIIARGITLKIQRTTEAGPTGEVTEVHDFAGPTRLDREETFETLKPGESLATPIPIEKRPAGKYQVTASYSSLTAKQGDWWGGTLTAGPIMLEIQ
ncbi:MAG TPA: hypothetical protein VF469_34025 [Kofleriaceae bacterium]